MSDVELFMLINGLRKSLRGQPAAPPPPDYGPLIAVGPRVSYAQPAESTTLDPAGPWLLMVNNAAAGTSFWFPPGTYRATGQINPKSNQQFHFATSATLKGSVIVSGTWVTEDDRWYVAGQSSAGTGGGVVARQSDGAEASTRLDELFIDGVMLLHVADLVDVTEGRWHFSATDGRIYVGGTSPAGKLVERANVTRAFGSNAAEGVTIKNATIKQYATPTSNAIIQGHTNWLVENCDVSGAHGVGVSAGSGMVVRACNVHRNGQMGFAGFGAVGAIVENCWIHHNNYRGAFDFVWEAGACKFVNTRNLVLRRNLCEDNVGFGLWCDINNKDVLWERNHCRNNEATGMFQEIGYEAIIRNNLVEGNGIPVSGLTNLAGTVLSTVGGILVISSRGVEVHDNISRNNRGGQYRFSHREIGPGNDGDWILRDLNAHDNYAEVFGDANPPTGQQLVEIAYASGQANILTGYDNVIDNNTYLRSTTGAVWRRQHVNYSIADWRASPFLYDLNSTVEVK